MKTYIWNTEYEVLATIAPTQWEAQRQLGKKILMDFVNYINEAEEPTKSNRIYAEINNVREKLNIICTTPHVVMEPNSSEIMYHAND